MSARARSQLENAPVVAPGGFLPFCGRTPR